MKKAIFTTLLSSAFLTAWVDAQVMETPATLALTEGGNPQGYVQNANDQGVTFSTTPGGRGQLVPYSRIRGEGIDKLIRFDERAEQLEEPRALFAAGDYDAAAAAFGKVAKDYAIILGAPRNFATEALFYQLESIRRSGKFGQLPPLVNSAAAKSIEKNLGEEHRRLHEFQKMLSLMAEEKTDELAEAISAYEEPVVGDAKLLGTPNFKKLPSSELHLLSFLRGKVYEARDEKGKALDDYYAACTLAYGNDDTITKLAMGAAMVIQKEDPLLASENQTAVAEMQSIAFLFSKRFGRDSMPPEFEKFAVPPPVVRPSAEQQEALSESEPTAEEGAAEEAAEEEKESDKGEE
ncbi:MAG: hypothetical protein WD342_04655 [Verrucomicrobiales bacterium]